MAQKQLTEGQLDTAVERHLADCQDCQDFRHAMERFLDAKPAEPNLPDPPERLTLAVRAVAAERLNLSSANRQRCPWPVAWWLAAAAAFILVGWIVGVLAPPSGSDAGIAEKGASASAEVVDSSRQWDVDMQDNICDLQIAIELDMATVCSSSGDDDGGVEEVLDELDQNNFSLPPIWS